MSGAAYGGGVSDTLGPLSLLDLAMVRRGQPVAEALRDSLALAQHAEATGRFTRIWYAEHHNMPTIASAATAVLIASRSGSPRLTGKARNQFNTRRKPPHPKNSNHFKCQPHRQTTRSDHRSGKKTNRVGSHHNA